MALPGLHGWTHACTLSKTTPTSTASSEKSTSGFDRTLDLIAAENHAPRSIMEVLGSVFNTKTIEGVPGAWDGPR